VRYNTSMQIPTMIQKLSKVLKANGARAIVVGGAVRDHFLNIPSKDYDIEVYGIEKLETLEKILSAFGSVNLVGKNFGVLKFQSGAEVYDFSLPRFESKVGKGHRGFHVEVDGNMDFGNAAKRRDFTLNAMGYDIEEQCFLDPFGGKADMHRKKLRHIDKRSFAEDPLRVYRAIQFAARFGYSLADETEILCREMVEEGLLEELPKERIYSEIKKLLLKSKQPSIGFELMYRLGILERYFPELYMLIGVPQDPKWHPEGDVWVHTMLSLDFMAKELKIEDEKKRLKFLFSILCHDFGKPLVTTIELKSGKIVAWQEYRQNKSISKEIDTIFRHIKRIRAIGHEKAGLEPTRKFMYRLTDEHDFILGIFPLVAHHLKPSQFYRQGAKAGAIRRLATQVNIEELILVAKADFFGRGDSGSIFRSAHADISNYPAGEWLLEKAKMLKVEKGPLPHLLSGKDLIGLGLKPSPEFKVILHDLYEKQMEEVFETKEDALAYVRNRYLK